MTPHGPDAESYEKFVSNENSKKGNKIPEGNYAFMFESGYLLKTTKYALKEFMEVDEKYSECWQKLSELKFEA